MVWGPLYTDAVPDLFVVTPTILTVIPNIISSDGKRHGERHEFVKVNNWVN